MSAAPTQDEIGLYAFRVWGYKQGELTATLIHLGDRLGLFRALAGTGTTDAPGLAAAMGLHERWLLEWLRAMAAADLLESPDGKRFTLPAAAEAVLVDEDHLAFAAGAFTGGHPEGFVDQLAEAFRTGIGPDYDAQGPQGAHGTERTSAAWARTALVPSILPRLEGVVVKLEAGARVLDVACGGGVAMAALARAFPATQVDGVDLSRHAIERAERNLEGLTNATCRLGRAEEVTEAAAYDLILTFDCLHDMTRPAEAIAAVRRAVREDGTWLAKEIRCWPTWQENRKNPMLAMFYGFSVTGCMASATSEPGGAALGTVGLPGPLLQELAQAAGFTRFATHDVDDPANLYYEIRV
ncbi:MAG: class I SAM-dependent methyltransferase [Acidimicrobiales bacterium]|nr:class I SAM-dependent methyltransferase [Acidimicrobiales bacterium]